MLMRWEHETVSSDLDLCINPIFMILAKKMEFCNDQWLQISRKLQGNFFDSTKIWMSSLFQHNQIFWPLTEFSQKPVSKLLHLEDAQSPHRSLKSSSHERRLLWEPSFFNSLVNMFHQVSWIREDICVLWYLNVSTQVPKPLHWCCTTKLPS